MELTEEKESQIVQLLQVITEETALFRKTSSTTVVKIPFSILKEKEISPDKAENLIGYMNRISGSYEEGLIEILNGTIYKYKDGSPIVGTMYTESFDVLENVKIDDDERFLLLWLHNFGKLKKKVMDSLRFNVDTAPQHIVIEDTPDDSKWSFLQLRFIDGCTLHAFMHVNNSNWNKTDIGRKELGLEKTNGLPKEQWHLLEEAANNNGRIKLSSSKIDPESKRKQITGLKKLLKEVFPKLQGEPFSPMGDAYVTTFEILPIQREEN